MSNLLRRVPQFRTLSYLSFSAIQKYNRPLPKLSSHQYSTQPPDSDPPIDDSFLPEPIDRSHETPAVTRARLLYQSRKRGILETDLLLSTFAKKNLATMSEADMKEYDKLLDEPDWEIYYWATQRKPAPEEWKDSRILGRLKEHVKNEGKVILRMPDLDA
jgi:succinate dehydrogenase assembly factor 2